MNLDECLADELTDEYGWCIRSLEYQILWLTFPTNCFKIESEQ
jgi:hypothetical protein